MVILSREEDLDGGKLKAIKRLTSLEKMKVTYEEEERALVSLGRKDLSSGV